MNLSMQTTVESETMKQNISVIQMRDFEIFSKFLTY